MAQVTRVNPVVDGLVDTLHSGAFNGRDVEVFEVDAAVDISGSVGPEGALAAIIKTVLLQASIEVMGALGNIYLFSNTGTQAGAGQGIRFMVSPKGAWTAATLQTAIRALGTVNTKDLSSATVTTSAF